MIERRRESTVVKQMGHGAWAVEQTTKPIILLSIAHVTVLMREPLHQLVLGRDSRRTESSRVFLEGFCLFSGGAISCSDSDADAKSNSGET
jgi:hypothetical protein